MNAQDIAHFLRDHPDFFVEHGDVFADMRVPHAHGGQAISLADRQLQTVREKAKALELRLADLLRHAKDNENIHNRLFTWVRDLLAHPASATLPVVLVQSLGAQFNVPATAIKLWNVAADYSDETYARGVSEDVRIFTNGLMAPFCGDNAGVEAAGWLESEEPVRSMALIPLRESGKMESFGLLVLGSPDPERFAPNMGTAFLARIGELASSALSRLIHRK